METKAPNAGSSSAGSSLARPQSSETTPSAPEGDPLDVAGKNALEIIQRAASAARESSKLAITTVQELSLQLQTANSRITELEARLRHYQDKVERSQKWFSTISTELQRQFLEVPGSIQADPTHNRSPSTQR